MRSRIVIRILHVIVGECEADIIVATHVVDPCTIGGYRKTPLHALVEDFNLARRQRVPRTGTYEKVLVVGAEILTRALKAWIIVCASGWFWQSVPSRFQT